MLNDNQKRQGSFQLSGNFGCFKISVQLSGNFGCFKISVQLSGNFGCFNTHPN